MRRHAPLLFAALLAVLLGAWLVAARAEQRHEQQKDMPVYPAVVPGHALAFPRDYGSHAEFRTEWWYVTGWLRTASGAPLGFQVTFFRSRPPLDQRNPSRFAPRELLFAHAAISDPALGKLQHDERSARSGFGLATAADGDTDVHIGKWFIMRTPGDRYRTTIEARDFTLQLVLETTQPPLVQGDQGYSSKGPRPAQASYYYSSPHLKVSGTVMRQGKAERVSGDAWLDHEWSSEYLAEEALGWDWAGINLDDGSALMAFQMRDKTGGKFWAGGALRRADGSVAALAPSDVSFSALRRWRSPRTGIDYPVAMQLRAGEVTLDLMPLMDDQELDSRASTGAIYWEGAVTARQGARTAGRGYLELTGYSRRVGF
ncbi:AttH component of AttEFGH ABC transport system [Caballeronia glathei]|uniref:AttH domain-containing protein n=2 Tax=Caballeronia glathei TaxID=60547 RepID=A0A069PV33_9BURK|nr:lipocalin-like domain-containing protein [Caballeronia glathei]KDR43679.1 hypothetical protein BG61_32825 [Caballeronia glathei]CDY75710.1 AttH component of AttEFGH ABC transport system [Caballeronia glathei]